MTLKLHHIHKRAFPFLSVQFPLEYWQYFSQPFSATLRGFYWSCPHPGKYITKQLLFNANDENSEYFRVNDLIYKCIKLIDRKQQQFFPHFNNIISTFMSLLTFKLCHAFSICTTTLLCTRWTIDASPTFSRKKLRARISPVVPLEGLHFTPILTTLNYSPFLNSIFTTGS